MGDGPELRVRDARRRQDRGLSLWAEVAGALFYSVDLSVNGGETIIISGSDEKLNEFRPKLVNCFFENK